MLIEAIKKIFIRPKNTASTLTFDVKVKEEVKENSEELKLTVCLLKEKNNEFLQEEKTTDYERNKFLYEIGFRKLKRVRDFIETMNKVGNIEELKRLEKKFSKYNVEVLNKELFDIVKRNYSLKEIIHKEYDGALPNSAIDLLKLNYNNLKKDNHTLQFYRKYYSHNPWEEINDEILCSGFLARNKDSINNGKEDILYEKYYWKCGVKDLIVLYNNLRGLVLLEVSENVFLVLTEWNNNVNGANEKMNFKEFIKNNN